LDLLPQFARQSMDDTSCYIWASFPVSSAE